MNRNLVRTCLVIGLLGFMAVGGLAALWYWFCGRGGTGPVLRLVQPVASLEIRSGQGVVVIVEGESALGMQRIELLVDGQFERAASALGESRFRAIFPWFSSDLGDHDLRAIGYDRSGRASQPVFVVVRVQAADVRAALENALALDVDQTIEDVILQAEGAGQSGGAGEPAGAGQPPQAGDEPPVAELVVTPIQRGDSVVANVLIGARDDVGMSGMLLIVQSPSGEPTRNEYDCERNLECSRELELPLGEEGEWIFNLDVMDVAAQEAQQQSSLDVACDPNLRCAPAEGNNRAPGAPLPGEPPQGDGERPTVILKVTPQRNGNAIAAIVEMRARDNVGVGVMNLRIQSPGDDAEHAENSALGCDGNPACDFEFVLPLAEPGRWMFVLEAFDLSRQRALPQMAVVEVICLRGVDANNQPIEDCSVANEEFPAPGNNPGNLPPWANAANPWWDRSLAAPVFEPLDPVFGMFGGQVPPEPNPQQEDLPDFRQAESFDINGCMIQLPVLPNATPPNITQCPDWNLRGVDLRRVDLQFASLQGTDFTDARLNGSKLREADLSGAILDSVRMDALSAPSSNLQGATAVGARFGYSDLSAADLRNASMIGSSFSATDLTSADLSGAVLTNSSFWHAILINAVLRGADFSGADLTGADLTGADVTNVIWLGAICPDGSTAIQRAGADRSCEGHLTP
ncbi:MAG: pentapeptide repeat-containing protein [Chloroflexota bacterium]